ncbi:MAG: hypothetical protein AB1726_03405 [Planctomycetota bacterium]
MERLPQSSNVPSRIERQISHLKIVSRLLGHELHAQTSPRLTLSREEVAEIQTSIDLFIEDVVRSQGRGVPSHLPAAETEVQAVQPRIN